MGVGKERGCSAAQVCPSVFQTPGAVLLSSRNPSSPYIDADTFFLVYSYCDEPAKPDAAKVASL